MLGYDEVIDCGGILVPFVRDLIPQRMERHLRAGRHHAAEARVLRQTLQPGDHLLLTGSGAGLLAAVAAGFEGVRVTLAEPDPAMMPLAQEILRLNGALGVDLRNIAVAAQDGPDLTFPLRGPLARPGGPRAALVPCIALSRLIAEISPSVILPCDSRGLAEGILETADLSGLRSLILPVAPREGRSPGLGRILGGLAARGLAPARTPPGKEAAGHAAVGLYTLNRDRAGGHGPFPPRGFRDWPIRDPRIHIATCMKDEGPFILEWVAWHRSMGVTDITVFTNDCSDGTDLLLERLEAMGHVRTLPNPAASLGLTTFQPVALNYAHLLPQMREADFFISMDVDEFLNVRTGDHSLAALFDATGPFDVLSVSEVNHGSNRREHYERGWLTELFPLHQTVTPGKRRSRRGVKSITRLSDRVERLRNHRPDMREDYGPILWLDGSGRMTGHFTADRGENGHDARGSFDLVRLEHFPLRSLDSYLAKMYRGDVVVTGKRVSQTYWRLRNRHDEASGDYGEQLARARDWHDRHLAGDARLMALHEACCAAHEARIAQLVRDPDFMERRQWALNECWTGLPAGDDDDAPDGDILEEDAVDRDAATETAARVHYAAE